MPHLPNIIPEKFNGLAVILDQPTNEDFQNGRAFSSSVARFALAAIRLGGLDPNQCYLGYLARVEDPNEKATFDSNAVTEGITTLREELATLSPTTCLLFGDMALKAFNPKAPASVYDYRGSLFLTDGYAPAAGTKCIATIHPSIVFRSYEYAPLVQLDVKRACVESTTRRLQLPVRSIETSLDYASVVRQLERCLAERVPLAVDIEGGLDGVTCIGYARSASDCFVVPFIDRSGARIFTAAQEAVILRLIGRIHADSSIRKYLQNSLYDNFVLSYLLKCPIVNVADDIMLKHWELYAELPKSLALQTSIYTHEPFYKADRKTSDFQTYLRYCGKDCCVTHEINSVLETQLSRFPGQMSHYRINTAILPAFLYMELQGIRYNAVLAAERRERVLRELYTAQYQIDLLAGKSVDIQRDSIFTLFERGAHCVSVKARKAGIFTIEDFVNNLLSPYRPFAPRLRTLLAAYPNWSEADNAEFCEITETGMNIRGGEFKTWFFKTLGVPPVLNRKTKEVTTDYETVLRLYKRTKNPLCGFVLTVGDARTHEQMLAISADRDGRIRCAYNLVGTTTGRITCYTSPTGSGYNLQTIPEKDRDLFMADDGYEMGQCDLDGADAWTVAAHCKALGDPTMLDDMKAGVKVAKVLALMFKHGANVSLKSRDELRTMVDTIHKSEPIYFGSKCCQHGTNYGMAEVTMSFTIFKQSEGAIDIPAATCTQLKKLYVHRYWGVPLWHQRVQGVMKQTRELHTACGHIRRILDRVDEYSTLQAILSSEPQTNTTYATNLALYNLWYDPENRNPDGSLIIRPMHQVHDALLVQWPIHLREWALNKMRQYFNNEITIAGQKLVIPFAGTYGPTWGTKLGEFK